MHDALDVFPCNLKTILSILLPKELRQQDYELFTDIVIRNFFAEGMRLFSTTGVRGVVIKGVTKTVLLILEAIFAERELETKDLRIDIATVNHFI